MISQSRQFNLFVFLVGNMHVASPKGFMLLSKLSFLSLISLTQILLTFFVVDGCGCYGCLGVYNVSQGNHAASATQRA